MQEDVFARVDGAAEEIRTNTRYFWDNSKRSESNRINLQRTLAGEGFFENSQRRYAVPAGKLMAFTQRENSRYGYPATATQPYRLRYLSIDPTATATPLFHRIRKDFGPVLTMPEGSESAALFDQIYHHAQHRTFRDRYQESDLITQLLTAIYRQQVEETQRTNPIEYGYHLLQNRFASPITLKDIAQSCSITREHFIRAFSQRYGQSPGAYLRKLRLEQARSLLQTTQYPLDKIASASGFSSANVLCRSFRQTYGQTPTSLRP